MGNRIIILLLIIIILIGGIVGIYYYNKAPLSVHVLKTEISITSTDLVAAYEDDEDLANEQYLNKVMEVNGRIAELSASDNLCTVYLDSDSPLSQVIVEFEDCGVVLKMKKGDSVVIKGICTGYLADVIINRAIRIL